MPKTILIVDDDLAFGEIASDLLEDHGFKGVIVKSGEEALDWLKSKKPDALLLDLNMPGMGGMELLRRIKSDTRTSAIPVVVCTVSSGQRFKEEVLGLGASDFMPKPSYIEHLAPCLKKILDVSDSG